MFTKALTRRLTGAAALSVLAHLEDLVERGLVRMEGSAALGAIYRPHRPEHVPACSNSLNLSDSFSIRGFDL